MQTVTQPASKVVFGRLIRLLYPGRIQGGLG
jgi:hypothetical protein